jgi:chaperonin cofactor prefoldin
MRMNILCTGEADGGPPRAVEPNPPMVPPTPTPSARLVRAAAAERAELARHRDRLLAARDRLRAELDGIEASLRELDERDALLDRLAGPTPAPVSTPAVRAGATPLRGPAIRHAAIEVLRARPDRPQALHYRDWFEALGAAGYAVAGKDPLAVFLTQLSRSPVVRRGTQSGVYELDPGAPRRLRERLDALHAELRGLTAAPSATADLTAIRARRAALTTEITRVEKALEEAEAVLGAAAGPVAAAG